jgi:hypothetical protein
MNREVNKNCKYPANIKLRATLQYGDKRILAEKSGLKYSTVVAIFDGDRSMTERLKEAYIELIQKRVKLNKSIESIAKLNNYPR